MDKGDEVIWGQKTGLSKHDKCVDKGLLREGIQYTQLNL